MEVQFGGNELELNNKQLSGEHILSESPTEEWSQNFQRVDIENYIYRIGNLTLLEADKNRTADRKPFGENKAIYQTSNYRLATQSITTDNWVPKSVTERQKELNRALAIWNVNY